MANRPTYCTVRYSTGNVSFNLMEPQHVLYQVLEYYVLDEKAYKEVQSTNLHNSAKTLLI